ncbi:FAD-dependent monooxygenase [Pelagibacterium halotolerans]|uniref:FAD-dependent monooxygenase n=1 Tax=Pelagibacterium halotolerans TaxID=531813 RepID=UPI0038512B07
MAEKTAQGTRRGHDIIIVGGGPAGLTLAVALVRSVPGIDVALVDRRPLSVPRDARASAIAAGVRRVFEAIDVWPGMADAANPIRAMKITDSGTGDIARPLFLSFEGEVGPGEAFAHMVPNTASAVALLAAAEGQVTLYAPVAISGFSGHGARAELTLEDGRVLTAPLAVAADGGNSALRGMAKIGVFSHDYKQSGIVTTIGHEMPHEDTAYEHFRPAGPFASLPLKGNFSSLVWTETPDRAQALVAMDAAALAGEIEAAMGASLGAVHVADTVQAFPLGLKLARQFVGARVALIGDAAHVIHPIAGQGLNLGLKDVAVLAEVLVDAMRLGEDHGAADVLARYERFRRFDTALMAGMTDGLNRLFSNDLAPVRALRDFGLSVVDRLGPVKEGLIHHAAGADGAKLLRGVAL